MKGSLNQFLRNLGFKKEFEFIAEGDLFVRGRAKCLIYAVYEAHTGGVGANESVRKLSDVGTGTC